MAKSKYKWSPLALAASSLAFASAIAVAALPQASTLNITLTGQSMIRGDIRVHTPAAAATISPLLKGDVIFTNFEATVIEKAIHSRWQVSVPA